MDRALFGLVLVVGVSSGLGCDGGRAHAAEPVRRAPVLVELFTSEGCSSCPPADGELARLERDQPVPGATVIPLALHVDYWNDLGWPDPFSSAVYTHRQQAYTRALGARTTYTPQAVIDGQDELVGSSRGGMERAVAAAAKRPHVDVTIARGATAGSLEVVTGALPDPGVDVELVVFWVEPSAKVVVPRGENAGRTLEHTAVVRSVTSLGRATPSGGRATLSLGARPPRAARVVVALQERARRRVLGAGIAPLP